VQPSATSSEIALFITPEKTGVTINIQTLKEKLETQTNTGLYVFSGSVVPGCARSI
jgi:hypothetical protein